MDISTRLNFLFVGNPGTGKTTVGGLFAGILVESGLRKIVVNSANNSLMIQEAGAVSTITLLPGKYAIAELVAEVSSKLSSFQVSYDNTTGLFRIENTSKFTILNLGSTSLGLLGFSTSGNTESVAVGDVHTVIARNILGTTISANHSTEILRDGPDAFETLCNDSQEGTLFIDEAYLLTAPQGSNNTNECKILNILLRFSEENRDNTSFILAGYKDKIAEMFLYNPGFQSRFPRTVEFVDYDNKLLAKIYRGFIKERNLLLESKKRMWYESGISTGSRGADWQIKR